jgi:hypothetical protein
MPRYFFNIVHAGCVHRDRAGTEFSDERAALAEARLVAGELVRDAAFAQRPLDHVIEVCDSDGNVVIAFRCTDPAIVADTSNPAPNG